MENHNETMPGVNKIESGVSSIDLGIEMVKSQEASMRERENERIVEDITTQTINFSTKNSVKRGNAGIEIGDLEAGLALTSQVFKDFDGKVAGVFPHVNTEIPTGLNKQEKIRAKGAAEGAVRDVSEKIYLQQIIELSGKDGGKIDWRDSGYADVGVAKKRLEELKGRIERISTSLANSHEGKTHESSSENKTPPLPRIYPEIRTHEVQVVEQESKQDQAYVKTISKTAKGATVLGLGTMVLSACVSTNGEVATPVELPSETASEVAPSPEASDTPEDTPIKLPTEEVPTQEPTEVPGIFVDIIPGEFGGAGGAEASFEFVQAESSGGEVNTDFFKSRDLARVVAGNGALSVIDENGIVHLPYLQVPISARVDGGVSLLNFDKIEEGFAFYSSGGIEFKSPIQLPENEDYNYLMVVEQGEGSDGLVYLAQQRKDNPNNVTLFPWVFEASENIEVKQNGEGLVVHINGQEYTFNVEEEAWEEVADWLEKLNIFELPKSLEDVVAVIDYDREDQEGFSAKLEEIGTTMIEQAVEAGIDSESVTTLELVGQLDGTAAGSHIDGPWLWESGFKIGLNGDAYYQLTEVMEDGDQVGHMLSVLVRDQRGEDMEEITDRMGFNVIHFLMDNEAYSIIDSINDRANSNTTEQMLVSFLSGELPIQDYIFAVAGPEHTGMDLTEEQRMITERFLERWIWGGLRGLDVNEITTEYVDSLESEMMSGVAVVGYIGRKGD